MWSSRHDGLVPEPQKPARVLLDWQILIELEKCLSQSGSGGWGPRDPRPLMVLSDKVRERTATGVLSVSASNTPRDNISTHDISDMGGRSYVVGKRTV